MKICELEDCPKIIYNLKEDVYKCKHYNCEVTTEFECNYEGDDN